VLSDHSDAVQYRTPSLWSAPIVAIAFFGSIVWRLFQQSTNGLGFVGSAYVAMCIVAAVYVVRLTCFRIAWRLSSDQHVMRSRPIVGAVRTVSTSEISSVRLDRSKALGIFELDSGRRVLASVPRRRRGEFCEFVRLLGLDLDS
jgi:hypothetical protein